MDAAGEKVKNIILSKASKTRIDAAKENPKLGFFWDDNVFKSEENMVAAVAVHLDIFMGIIEEGVFQSATMKMAQDAVAAMDNEHGGKLQAMPDKTEWLRMEGGCFRRLLSMIRLKEANSINFSRCGVTMRMVCGALRKQKASLSKDSKTIKRSVEKDRHVEEDKPRPFWEMSPASVKKRLRWDGEVSASAMLPWEDDEPSEVIAIADSPAPAASASAQFFHDYGKRALCLLLPDGTIEFGQPCEGSEESDPFLWFSFADGAARRSEFAKILPVADKNEKGAKKNPVMKKPAAAKAVTAKKPLAAALVQAEVKDKDSNEEQEEEETEEEDVKEDDAILEVQAQAPKRRKSAIFKEKEAAPKNEGAIGPPAPAEEAAPAQNAPLRKAAPKNEKPVVPPVPQSWIGKWAPGAALAATAADGRGRVWTFSNAHCQGSLTMTYAKDQTYVHCQFKGGNKVFFGGLSCGYLGHQDIMQDSVGELLCLDEGCYTDILELKKSFLLIRDKLKQGSWIEE